VYLGDGSDCGDFTYSGPFTCNNPFEDISATGTPVSVPPPGAPNLGDDGFVTGIPIGFTFNYFGDSKTEVSIASNGFISFGTDGLGTFMPPLFPNTALPNDTIGPLWTDLDAGMGSPTISYQTLGTAPSRRFIVSWKNIPRFGQTDMNSFQVALLEGSN